MWKALESRGERWRALERFGILSESRLVLVSLGVSRLVKVSLDISSNLSSSPFAHALTSASLPLEKSLLDYLLE